MNNYTTLGKVAAYSIKRIPIKTVTVENYVTVDNLLQNKQGVVRASNMPTISGSVPGYDEGDILVGNIRPYLKKIWFANRSGGASADVLILSVKKEYSPKYVYYSMFLDDFFAHMMRGKKGTKMPRGDKRQVLEYSVSVHEYATQKKIADVLSSLDDKIDLNNRINTELTKMAKTLFDYWFVQFDFPDINGKSYKSSGGKMVYNDALKREIPAGWGVGNLFDIADYTNGLACQKFRPRTGEESLRVIKIKEMHEGYSTESELVTASIPSKVVIENGDVLFSWSASLEVQIWSQGRGALNQHIFKVTSNKYPKSFYFFQLLNYLQHFKMMAENRKTTMGHITQDHLEQGRVILPPKELAENLEQILSPMFKKVMINSEENQKLVELRDWLLPMLMNGQITVT
jgi:type I restriction enzyme S subunit